MAITKSFLYSKESASWSTVEEAKLDFKNEIGRFNPNFDADYYISNNLYSIDFSLENSNTLKISVEWANDSVMQDVYENSLPIEDIEARVANAGWVRTVI
jgi:hypothetical protein